MAVVFPGRSSWSWALKGDGLSCCSKDSGPTVCSVSKLLTARRVSSQSFSLGRTAPQRKKQDLHRDREAGPGASRRLEEQRHA